MFARLGLLLVVLTSAAFAQTPRPPSVESDTFTCVLFEVQPQLVGGLAALQEATEYPPGARAEGIEGRVIVQFLVTAEGVAADPVVLRSPDERLSGAALAAVRRIRFEPGTQRGRPIAVRFALPVTFRLE